eukprot:TRINITY_DN6566_c0_g1_i1.p1 TRINITY_DN6566_c0_g1~~TRINITY_DN6566_c0_g1_i1.p1  ORF type:complete len:271 (+),score=45.94 TRINITY_DN6566_c0_g1_i1:63-875(+)
MVQVSKHSEKNEALSLSQQDELASTCTWGSSALSSTFQLQDLEQDTVEQTLDSSCIGSSSRSSLREQGSMILAMMGQQVAPHCRRKKDRKPKGMLQSQALPFPRSAGLLGPTAAPVPRQISAVPNKAASRETKSFKQNASCSRKKFPDAVPSEKLATSYWPMDQSRSQWHQQHADQPLSELSFPQNVGVDHDGRQAWADPCTPGKDMLSPRIVVPSYVNQCRSIPAEPSTALDDFEPMKVSLPRFTNMQRMPDTSSFDSYFFDFKSCLSL